MAIMKKFYFLLINSLFLTSAIFAGETDYTKGLSIWFDTPNGLYGETARHTSRNPDAVWHAAYRNSNAAWESQSLPIGNGSLGASIIGSVETECITFNEKTLWRGGPNTAKGAEYYWNVNKQSAHVLDEIRKAFTEGDQQKAEILTRQNFNSEVPYEANREKPFRFGNFTIMGEFYVETGLDTLGISDYKRILSLDSALAVVQFKKDNVAYQRSYFISYPANVMVMRFSADRAGMQNLVFSYAPNSISQGSLSGDGDKGLVFSASLNNNGMKYVVRIQAETKGGTLSNTGCRLTVKGADEVVFYVTADTDYKMNFNPDFKDPKTYVGVDPAETTCQWINNAVMQGYTALFQQHYSDYAALFNRVRLNLNPTVKTSEIPTPQRLKNYRNGQPDYYLEELYYQFGRYLLIASSRAGNMPANLQGIWHNDVDGPWRVDYHNNINVQMNYWPACPTNLSECMLPLVDFIRTLVKPGEKTAQSYFGARGWTASISSNIFGFTTPLESQDMSCIYNRLLLNIL